MNVNNIGNESYIKPKLLLVDNDEVTADIIKIFVSDRYQVDWVTNGIDAISKANENNYAQISYQPDPVKLPDEILEERQL
jgi:CheY-like chemotaxis protein